VRKNSDGGEQSRRDASLKPYRSSPGAGSQHTGLQRPALPNGRARSRRDGEDKRAAQQRELLERYRKERTHFKSGQSPDVAPGRSHHPTEPPRVEDRTCGEYAHARPTHTNSVGAPSKNLVFHKMSFKLELNSRNMTRACDARRGVAWRVEEEECA
jgi:hypothetical protein